MDAVEDIKSRLSIEDVIGEYVQLKRAGHNWRGLSPFSNERTPSFMVSPEKQIWHDFSSGKGGNIFSFVMEMEGLDFKGAFELLARKAGVDLSQYSRSSSSTSGNKERLYEVLEAATKFYQRQFTRNQKALDYVLKQRKFSRETVLEWRLGFSPNGGAELVNFLKSRNFTDREIKAAGLSTQRYNGLADMFRGRIMIPLADPQGRVIGFTARLLENSDNSPKYINTPATILYNKSTHVFGLHLAKEAIRTNKFVVVSEGNLDVIMSHQASVRQVVAVAGTAMTEQHLKILGRFTEDIRLCFDADNAGINATERVVPMASKLGVNLSVIKIPSGKDPDELIKQDAKVWQEIIEKPQYALDWLIERYARSLDLASAAGKRQFSDTILAVVNKLSDKVEQEHYIDKVAQLTDVSREAVMSKLHPEKPRLLKPKKAPEKVGLSDKDLQEMTKTQDRFMTLVLTQPKLRDFLEPITEGMLFSLPAQQLLQFLNDNPEFVGDAKAAALEPETDYVKILLLQYEELYADLELLELRYEASRLQARLIKHYVNKQKKLIADGIKTADEIETARLLKRARQLDELLKQTMEV